MYSIYLTLLFITALLYTKFDIILELLITDDMNYIVIFISLCYVL